MGITCKTTGKMRGLLKKVDNMIENDKKILKEKKNNKKSMK